MLFGSVCCGICEETEVKAAFEEEELQQPQLVLLSRLAGVASNPMVRTVLIAPKAAAPSGGRPTKRRRRSSGGRPTTRRRSTGGRPKTRRRRSTGGRPTTRRRHAGKIKSGWSPGVLRSAQAVADVATDKIGSFPGASIHSQHCNSSSTNTRIYVEINIYIYMCVSLLLLLLLLLLLWRASKQAARHASPYRW